MTGGAADSCRWSNGRSAPGSGDRPIRARTASSESATTWRSEYSALPESVRTMTCGMPAPLGGEVAAELGGVAHDDVRPPPLDEAGEVVDDVEGEGAGEHVGPGVLVAGRTGRDGAELGEAHRQLRHRPGGADRVVVVEAGRRDVGPERLRHGEGHVVAPPGQPTGDGEQRVEVADARQRREQHSHATIVLLRPAAGLETG